MEDYARIKIASILRDSVERTIQRTSSKKATLKPFHEALLTAEIIKASKFERSFSTSFGQSAIELISGVVARSSGYEFGRGQRFHLVMREGQENRINKILGELRDGKQSRRPNWESELEEIAGAGGRQLEMDVTVDLSVRKGITDCFYSIKTVLPNIDQTGEAKRLMLRLKANDPSCEVYFALYYNPYGEKKADYAWSMPFSIFDMHNDSCVLIGREYWQSLGGPGVYEELLGIFTDVGEYTRERLSIE